MIKSRYDAARRTVILEFEGRIDADQAERFLEDIHRDVPPDGGFRLLTDLSGIEEVDPGVAGAIKRGMDFFNSSGVTEIVRVIPDPRHDLGFNILSIFHYSKEVKIFTFDTRAEAEARLNLRR